MASFSAEADGADLLCLGQNTVNNVVYPSKQGFKDLIENASLLEQLETLCRSLLVEKEQFEVSFMEAVRILLTLTCTMPGATIYYTTDGSCPCDEQARQRYDGPIVIDKDMTINAIGVREGMDDSEVATFTYKVGNPSDIGITEVGQVSIEYDNDAFVIIGAEGGTCDVFDLAK